MLTSLQLQTPVGPSSWAQKLGAQKILLSVPFFVFLRSPLYVQEAIHLSFGVGDGARGEIFPTAFKAVEAFDGVNCKSISRSSLYNLCGQLVSKCVGFWDTLHGLCPHEQHWLLPWLNFWQCWGTFKNIWHRKPSCCIIPCRQVQRVF